MIDEYIAHGELLLDDMLYSEDELYHWKLGSIMSGHKWIERLGTPGHYIYKYAEDLHEALTGDKASAYYKEQAGEHGRAANQARTAAENNAAAAIIAKAMGRQDQAAKYYGRSLEKKSEYEKEQDYAEAYSKAVKDIANLPINRLRRSVKRFVGETSANLSTLVAKGADFLQGLFGKKKEEPKPRPEPSRPDRPHQRKKKTASGTAYVKTTGKVNWYEGWGKDVTGQQIMDYAAGKRR